MYGGKKVIDFHIDGDGTLRYQGRLCVPDINGLRERILVKSHDLCYAIYPGLMKMYHYLIEIYWCNNMKRDVAIFVAKSWYVSK